MDEDQKRKKKEEKRKRKLEIEAEQEDVDAAAEVSEEEQRRKRQEERQKRKKQRLIEEEADETAEAEEEEQKRKRKEEKEKKKRRAAEEKPEEEVEEDEEEADTPAPSQNVPTEKKLSKQDAEIEDEWRAQKLEAKAKRRARRAGVEQGEKALPSRCAEAGAKDNGPPAVKTPEVTSTPSSGSGGAFKVFIGGLPSHVDEAQIKKDFVECGEISELLISRWPADGTSRGMCFITWATEAAMKKCLAFHDTNYEGKYIRVEERKGVDKKDRPRSAGPTTKPPGCTGVAVFDLAPTVGEDELCEFFGKCGAVSSARVLKNRETGQSRGIGFVDFEVSGAVDQAMLLSGRDLAGKPIKIEFAKVVGDKGKGKGKGKGGDGNADMEKPAGCVSVVIRQMSTLVTEDDLWRLFADCTSAKNISILMDKDTFQSRGIAFIDFDDTMDTDKAVQKSGKLVCGQAVNIQYKMPRG